MIPVKALLSRSAFGLLLAGCLLLIADQFLLAHEERSVYIDQTDWIERRSTLGRGTRYSRYDPYKHRWSAQSASFSAYVAHLENGRRFTLGDHDNGVLQAGDSVRVEVAPFTGRVLRFQRLARGVNRTRESGDYFGDLLPFPVLLAALCTWLLLVRAESDAAYYLRMLILVVGLVFLISLFAVTWPLFRALGWI